MCNLYLFTCILKNIFWSINSFNCKLFTGVTNATCNVNKLINIKTETYTYKHKNYRSLISLGKTISASTCITGYSRLTTAEKNYSACLHTQMKKRWK